MKAHEIFQHASSDLTRDMFHYLRTEQKEVYQTAVATLAQGRKLRPVFIQRKRPEDQYVWLQKTTKLRGSEGVDEHLLQLWLLKAHQDLLVSFLDGVGIEHDGEGAADDLPEEIDAKKLKATIDGLLGDHDAELIRIYLHTFQLQKTGGWETIDKLIATDERLRFEAEEKEAPAANPPAPAADPGEAEEEAPAPESGDEEE